MKRRRKPAPKHGGKTRANHVNESRYIKHKTKPNRVNESRYIKSKKLRRTQADVAELLHAVQTILNGEDHQITVRHLFYRLVSIKAIEKTEEEYHAVVRHLSRWRRGGEVAWDAFADSTRWHIRVPTFDSIEDALRRTRETYRRNLWSSQRHYCEVWVEKDAIASIVADVANDWGVPVFVCRGFASLSSLYSASQTFKDAKENGKRVTIFHMGDYDPSGHAAATAIENTLEFDLDCEINFERIAVLHSQIEQFDLPTRPTKQSDSRSKKWEGDECVELDAMPPAEMRSIVEEAITDLIDAHEWEQMQKIEAAERESLERLRIVK